MFAVGHFETVAGRDRRHRGRAVLRPGAGRADGPDDPRPLAREARVRRARPIAAGRPGGAAVRLASPATTRTRSRDKLDALTRAWERNGHGYHTLRAETAGRAGRADQGAQGRARPADGRQRRAPAAGRVRRGHRRRARAPGRVRGAVPRRSSTAHGLEAGFYGHCSVGCLHIRPFVDLSEPGQVETMRAVAEEVSDLVARVRRRELQRARRRAASAASSTASIFGDELYEAMRQRQGACSTPTGRLNPGKMVDSPSMTEHLRDAELPRPRPLRTHLRLRREGGMRGAADRCMRIGACRKTGHRRDVPVLHGHARGGALHARPRRTRWSRRSSEPDPRAALGDERLHEILDLCLECKACKSECPLSVDMAALKSESSRHHHDDPRHAAALAAVRRRSAR